MEGEEERDGEVGLELQQEQARSPGGGTVDAPIDLRGDRDNDHAPNPSLAGNACGEERHGLYHLHEIRDEKRSPSEQEESGGAEGKAAGEGGQGSTSPAAKRGGGGGGDGGDTVVALNVSATRTEEW